MSMAISNLLDLAKTPEEREERNTTALLHKNAVCVRNLRRWQGKL